MNTYKPKYIFRYRSVNLIYAPPSPSAEFYAARQFTLDLSEAGLACDTGQSSNTPLANFGHIADEAR